MFPLRQRHVHEKAVGGPREEAGGDAFHNLALEEALFLCNDDGLTVRIWENEESIILGRAQLARFETDLGYCKDHSVPIVRRFTAGGTVYNGPGNINWSLFVARGVDAGSLRYESGPHEVFRMSSRPLVAALAASGVRAWLDPPNRILTEEGKISGMAAYISRRGFLCHGTLLAGADLRRVKALTTPSREPLERKYTRSRDMKTANVELDVDSFIRTLLSTLAEETKLTFERGSPDGRERMVAERLLTGKYSRDEWNLGDPFVWADDVETAALVG